MLQAKLGLQFITRRSLNKLPLVWIAVLLPLGRAEQIMYITIYVFAQVLGGFCNPWWAQ